MITKLLSSLSVTLLAINLAYASPAQTHRVAEFANGKVTVWKTIIFPSTNQVLIMHRHDRDRVLVAFDDGTLKITNDQGKSHYLSLQKNKAYYLPKDVPNEMHSDTNMGDKPIIVMVIELNG